MNAPASVQQVQAHLEAGRIDQAHALVSNLLRRAPRDGMLHHAMATIMLRQGRIDRALESSRQAAALAPDHPAVLVLLGALLTTTGRAEEASPLLSRACELDPGNADAWGCLVAALIVQRRLTDADEVACMGLRFCPNSAALIRKHADVLLAMGSADRAIELMGRAAFSGADSADLARGMAFASNYSTAIDHVRSMTLHESQARFILDSIGRPPFAAARINPASQPPEPLRIGILSPDLRDHAVGWFTIPLVRHLPRPRFHVRCYSAASGEDAVSHRLRSVADSWVWPIPATHLALARLIRDERIDVLIELSGLTAGHRLETMALRPAPLQATWLGYPATTGLAAIDLRIVDSLTDPPEAPPCGPEQLVRIDPCFLCFQPRDDAPPVRPRDPGPITFGSFNNLAKISDATVTLWAAVCRAVPGSRLVIKALSLKDPSTQTHTGRRFVSAGVDPARLSLLPPADTPAAHLAAYHRVDIALDTFPYHGTTTTCEALHMGVPVVTLAGSLHAGRVGASLLPAAGLADLVATSPERFVSIASGLASDSARLADLRVNLRSRLSASPLCDGPAFGRRFGEALLAAWHARAASV